MASGDDKMLSGDSDIEKPPAMSTRSRKLSTTLSRNDTPAVSRENDVNISSNNDTSSTSSESTQEASTITAPYPSLDQMNSATGRQSNVSNHDYSLLPGPLRSLGDTIEDKQLYYSKSLTSHPCGPTSTSPPPDEMEIDTTYLSLTGAQGMQPAFRSVSVQTTPTTPLPTPNWPVTTQAGNIHSMFGHYTIPNRYNRVATTPDSTTRPRGQQVSKLANRGQKMVSYSDTPILSAAFKHSAPGNTPERNMVGTRTITQTDKQGAADSSSTPANSPRMQVQADVHHDNRLSSSSTLSYDWLSQNHSRRNTSTALHSEKSPSPGTSNRDVPRNVAQQPTASTPVPRSRSRSTSTAARSVRSSASTQPHTVKNRSRSHDVRTRRGIPDDEIEEASDSTSVSRHSHRSRQHNKSKSHKDHGKKRNKPRHNKKDKKKPSKHDDDPSDPSDPSDDSDDTYQESEQGDSDDDDDDTSPSDDTSNPTHSSSYRDSTSDSTDFEYPNEVAKRKKKKSAQVSKLTTHKSSDLKDLLHGLMKCGISKFDGDAYNFDITQWLREIDNYCNIRNISSQARVKVTSFFLTSEALDWYEEEAKRHAKNKTVWTWTKFKDQLKKRFLGTSQRYNMILNFEDRVQLPTESVQEYFKAMTSWGQRLSLSEQQVMHHIQKGLDPVIRSDVLRQAPKSLRALKEVAERCQTAYNMTKNRTKKTQAISAFNDEHIPQGSSVTDTDPFQSIIAEIQDMKASQNNAFKDIAQQQGQLHQQHSQLQRQQSQLQQQQDQLRNTVAGMSIPQSTGSAQLSNNRFGRGPCTYCGRNNHYTADCFLKKRDEGRLPPNFSFFRGNTNNRPAGRGFSNNRFNNTNGNFQRNGSYRNNYSNGFTLRGRNIPQHQQPRPTGTTPPASFNSSQDSQQKNAQ